MIQSNLIGREHDHKTIPPPPKMHCARERTETLQRRGMWLSVWVFRSVDADWWYYPLDGGFPKPVISAHIRGHRCLLPNWPFYEDDCLPVGGLTLPRSGYRLSATRPMQAQFTLPARVGELSLCRTWLSFCERLSLKSQRAIDPLPPSAGLSSRSAPYPYPWRDGAIFATDFSCGPHY